LSLHTDTVLFEGIRQILWVLRPNGSVERFNPYWTTYTGLPQRMVDLTWADGAYRWHRCQVTPLHGKDGRLSAWIGTALEIEDLRQAELKAQESERQKRIVWRRSTRDITDWTASGASSTSTMFSRRWPASCARRS